MPRRMHDESHLDELGHADDMIDGPAAATLSYTYQRIRLAEISRKLIDRNFSIPISLGTLSYSDIMDVDIELEKLINEMPLQFRLNNDQHSLHQWQVTSPITTSGSVQMQKYFINNLAHTHRCKLHLPYLKYAQTNSVYAYSRSICLASARSIILAELELEATGMAFFQTHLQSAGHLNGLFIAITALTLDSCYEGDSAAQVHSIQRKETIEAFRIVVKAAEHCDVANEFLESITGNLLERGIVLNLISGFCNIKQPSSSADIQQHGPGHELPDAAVNILAQSNAAEGDSILCSTDTTSIGLIGQANDFSQSAFVEPATDVFQLPTYLDRVSERILMNGQRDDDSWARSWAEMDRFFEP